MQALAPGQLLYHRNDVLVAPERSLKEHRAMTMTMRPHLSPRMALIVGILMLIFPRFLNYSIAIYLIVTGLIGLRALRSIGGP